MTEKKSLRVMFLCTANSCRSQMAEGLARHFGNDIVEPFSAGLLSHYVQPRAVSVMKEIGIDISGQTSKEIDPELLGSMDLIITLCDHADATCPSTPPRVRRLHWPVRDPVGTVGTEEEIMDDFRRARDEIKNMVLTLIQQLKSENLF